jgi:class 3 adenylate cyclase
MPAGHSSDVKLEIGHVLFIDIVGYSKLNIHEQSEQLETLKQIVRGTEQFKKAEAEGKLLRLPTGDGGALVFRTTPEAPVLCACEISQALKTHPDLHVRMGIHSGPVNEISDLNEQANIAGAGINFAQRVMDCGDAGHILLSKHVADDLEHYPRWQPYLHSLGECEVKHSVRIGVVTPNAAEVEKARAYLESNVRAQPEDADSMIQLGWINLALKRNEEALNLGRLAIEKVPMEQDAVAGGFVLAAVAELQARCGKAADAVKALERLLSIPAGLNMSLRRLKTDPVWDPIRNDPGFRQLLAGTELVGPNK